MPLLRMCGITKSFAGVRANHAITFGPRRGEVHALLGENGAGKTTLMNILFGAIQPDAGWVELRGRRIALRSPADALVQGIGMVHQHFMLVPNMTVAENIALSLHTTGSTLLKLAEVARGIRQLSDAYNLQVDPAAQSRKPSDRRPAAGGSAETSVSRGRGNHPGRAHICPDQTGVAPAFVDTANS